MMIVSGMKQAPEIQSPHNLLLKEIHRAVRRGGLTREGLCVAEGFHLLEEALRSGLRVPAVLASQEAAGRVRQLLRGRAETRLSLAGAELLARAGSTETTQGVIALVEPPAFEPGDAFRAAGPVVVLDSVQDPGNAGAIARAAEAFGASGLVWMKGTAARWNPKTLRASAGSLFRLPAAEGLETEEALSLLRRHGRRIYVAEPREGLPPWRADWREPCALVIGNEARGPQQAFRAAGAAVCIPTAGVESLNAAVAAAVLLYESMRQRGEK
jgi:TrmH family RNA methyltransferase